MKLNRDVFFFSLVVLMFVILILSVLRPIPDPYSELYFSSFRLLPNETDGVVSFDYAIHNALGADKNFDVRIVTEYFQGETLVRTERKQGTVVVRSDERKLVRESVGVSVPFERARITITTLGQRIHFWVRYSGNDVLYPESGMVRLDCVPQQTSVGKVAGIVLLARGQFAQGWPSLTIMHNGARIATVTVNTQLPQSYVVPLVSIPGDNRIEILYENDFFNGSSPELEDRNVFINEVRLGSRTLGPSNFVIEKGLPHEWFDCRSITTNTGAITSNGSLRLRYLQ